MFIEWRNVLFQQQRTSERTTPCICVRDDASFEVINWIAEQGNSQRHCRACERDTTNATQYFCNGSGGAPIWRAIYNAGAVPDSNSHVDTDSNSSSHRDVYTYANSYGHVSDWRL